MDLNADASQGFDLLSYALGRVPGASDLDEYVEFEVFFDGSLAAAERGEALAFLRARICEAFDVLGSDLDRYLWHRDRFILEASLGESAADEPRLLGHIRTGDGAEDEWFVVHLLRRWTAARPDISCRVVDNDGELLLIEAALAAPRWLSPGNAEHRCWLRGGKVHLLPKPRPPEPEQLPLAEALSKLRAAGGSTVAKEKVQAAIDARLKGYPKRAVELSRHVSRAILPRSIARMVIAYPQLVAVAVDHLPLPSVQELTRMQREVPSEFAGVRFTCEDLPDEEMVCVGVRFSRCQYARLIGLKCPLPRRYSRKAWRAPPSTTPDDKAMRLGMLLCAGLEAAFLQAPRSATAVLRWPAAQAKLREALLPQALPWWPDRAFERQAANLRKPLEPHALSARMAFLQQSNIEENFQAAFHRALTDPKLHGALDLSEHWQDWDDAEDWLDVSAEDLDQDMQSRQAEFDAYDKKRAARAPGGQDARRGAEEPPPDEDALRAELASMGREISGLLNKASSLDGLDVAGATAHAGGKSTPNVSTQATDSDSDESGSEDLDVLGMEEGASSGEEGSDDEVQDQDGNAAGSMHTYMSELDEQLEGALDAGLEDSKAPGEEMPLSSHHVKVHGAQPLELDVHAMEHLLASFCSEQHLDPGPASLLLGELGFTKGSKHAGLQSLNSMD